MKRIAIVVLLITVFLTMCGCRAWSQVEADFERARRGYQEMREACSQPPKAGENNKSEPDGTGSDFFRPYPGGYSRIEGR